MAASVTRLRTKGDRLKADQAAAARQAVLSVPGLPPRAVGEIVAAIDRNTASENGWTFVMMSPADNARVVSWLAGHSRRPVVAMQLWAKLFEHLRRDTGEIMLTRDEMAEAMGVDADAVSRIMTGLESIGAISRKREKVAGMRGPGVVRYFMSPTIGTHLTGAARDNAQAEAPRLTVAVDNT